MKEILSNVKSKEDLIEFINILINDIYNKSVDSNVKPLMLYLESIQSWIEDMDGYYINTKQDIPKDIDWNLIATLLYVGKIYE